MRIKVSRIISELDKTQIVESLSAAAAAERDDNLPAQLLLILQVISGMSFWAVEIRESWVAYYTTRSQICLNQRSSMIFFNHTHMN